MSERVEVDEDAQRFRALRPGITRKPYARSPLVRRVFLELHPPTLDNNVAEAERVQEQITRQTRIESMQMGLRLVHRLPELLREHDFAEVTATIGHRGDIAEVMDISGGDVSKRNYLAVVDVGTTTVVVHLVDAVGTTTVDAQACFNSQSVYGREVTARIIAAEKKSVAVLQEHIVEDINRLIAPLAARNDVLPKDITAVVCAGNTTMLHFLLGLPSRNIRRKPYIAGCVEPPPFRAAEPGHRIAPRGLLYCVPGISSWRGRHWLTMLEYTLTGRDLWVYDLSSGRRRPLTLGSEAYGPMWFPDGRRVAFGWLKDGRRSLAVQPADGTAPPRVLVAGEFIPSSFTLDGRQVAASRGEEDIVMVTVEEGHARVQPLIATPQNEGSAEFSPDGRWLAYASNGSGRFEVYVRPYPGPGATETVSLEGGRSPAWNRNGRELFFLSPLDPAGAGTQRMMAVDFAPGSSPRFGSAHGGLSAVEGPRIGRPRSQFEFDGYDLIFDCFPTRCYHVAPDGHRFYVVQSRTSLSPPLVTHINLIQNWFEELKAKAPAR